MNRKESSLITTLRSDKLQLNASVFIMAKGTLMKTEAFNRNVSKVFWSQSWYQLENSLFCSYRSQLRSNHFGPCYV